MLIRRQTLKSSKSKSACQSAIVESLLQTITKRKCNYNNEKMMKKNIEIRNEKTK